jgi:hypothetical protein
MFIRFIPASSSNSICQTPARWIFAARSCGDDAGFDGVVLKSVFPKMPMCVAQLRIYGKQSSGFKNPPDLKSPLIASFDARIVKISVRLKKPGFVGAQ